MHTLPLIAYFFGGVVSMNAVPHIVNGMSGRPFQSPFADPPGKGLSSAVVNFLWGFVNLVIGYLLLSQVGSFDPQNLADIGATALGGLLIGVWLARHFGNFHGGNNPG